MKIETERLIICEFTVDMAEDVHKNSLDDDNRRFVPDEVFETVEIAKGTVEFLIGQYDSDDGPFVYPIITKKNENIGYVQLVKIQEGWEVGYHIAKKYTGKGYATEAVKAFLPYIAEKMNLEKIWGICLKDNIASAKVMKKCGFENIFVGVGIYQGEEREIIKNKWKP